MLVDTTFRPQVTHTASPVILPFINTPPLVDVVLMFTLMPVWWALGLDQLVWLAAAPYIALRLIIQRRGRIRVPLPLRLLAVFIAIQAISALFIVEGERYITFIRTFGAYVAAFSIALVLVNTLTSPRHIRLILGVLVFSLIVAAILGLIAMLGIWRPTFTAPIALILPDRLENTAYGYNLIARRLGSMAWFSWFGGYFRVKSIFLYPTMYAAALIIILPLIVMYFWGARTIVRRAAWGAVTVLLGVNLLVTTGRTAWIGLIAGALFFVVVLSRWRSWGRVLFASACLLAISALAVLTWEEQGIPSALTEPVTDLLFARGDGSVLNRSAIYAETLTNWTRRPLFGWGTERDLPTLANYPAGSHSYYLGMLYRFGAIGMALFGVMVVSLWRATRPIPLARLPNTPESRELGRLLAYGRWIMIGVAVNAFTEVLDLDTTLLVLLWALAAVLICARHLAAGTPATQPPVIQPPVMLTESPSSH